MSKIPKGLKNFEFSYGNWSRLAFANVCKFNLGTKSRLLAWKFNYLILFRMKYARISFNFGAKIEFFGQKMWILEKCDKHAKLTSFKCNTVLYEV